jgi:hypothetical protein
VDFVSQVHDFSIIPWLILDGSGSVKKENKGEREKKIIKKD